MNKISLLIVALFVLGSCSKSLSKKEIEQYTGKGKEIAQATAKKLGGNLVKKMKAGGTEKAIPFCNTKADPLTKEMSKKYNVDIKRTSHKLRNEINSPNKEETKIINRYKSLFDEGKPLKPIVELDKSGKPHFYAPIKLQKKCLTCHGSLTEDINVKTDSIIKSYYPKDLAVGFKEGDLRGIWSITFKSEVKH